MKPVNLHSLTSSKLLQLLRKSPGSSASLQRSQSPGTPLPCMQITSDVATFGLLEWLGLAASDARCIICGAASLDQPASAAREPLRSEPATFATCLPAGMWRSIRTGRRGGGVRRPARPATRPLLFPRPGTDWSRGVSGREPTSMRRRLSRRPGSEAWFLTPYPSSTVIPGT